MTKRLKLLMLYLAGGAIIPDPTGKEALSYPVWMGDGAKGGWQYKQGWMTQLVNIRKSGDTYSCDYTAEELFGMWANDGKLPVLMYFSFTDDDDRMGHIYQFGGYAEGTKSAIFFASYAIAGLLAVDMAFVHSDKSITFEDNFLSQQPAQFFVVTATEQDGVYTANYSSTEIYEKCNDILYPLLTIGGTATVVPCVSLVSGAVIFSAAITSTYDDITGITTYTIGPDKSVKVDMATGSFLPAVTAEDAGKTLKVSSDGKWVLEAST